MAVKTYAVSNYKAGTAH